MEVKWMVCVQQEGLSEACNNEEREREEVGEGKKEGLKRKDRRMIKSLRLQGSTEKK